MSLNHNVAPFNVTCADIIFVTITFENESR